MQAFNFDGSPCVGFPIEGDTKFAASPTIDDLDNDGKNEIVISTMNAVTHVYKSEGHAVNNEWNCYRANCRNTATYKEVCNNVVDLMVRDNPKDLGKQPNNTTNIMWDSCDIWIRQNDDNVAIPESALYNPNSPNYGYVRVTNKSCVPSLGTEQLKLFMSKAGTSSEWPISWDGTMHFPAPYDNVAVGQLIGTMTVPVLQPGASTIVKFPFITPDPAIYQAMNNYDPSHFCMLARLDAPNDTPTEITDLVEYVKNNNNLAWVNFSIINPVGTTNQAPQNSAVVTVGNPLNEQHSFYLELQKEDLETGKDIFKEAEVTIKMDNVLYNAWVRGGKEAQQIQSTNNDKNKIVKGNHVILDNILFNPR